MQFEVVDHSHVYHHELKQMLESAYPQTTFSVLNAGVEGDSASAAISRLQRDVIRHNPDLVLVGFCLNDAMQGIKGIEEYSASMKAILAGITAETSADVILLPPNFMASRETDLIHEKHLFAAKPSITAKKCAISLASLVVES